MRRDQVFVLIEGICRGLLVVVLSRFYTTLVCRGYWTERVSADGRLQHISLDPKHGLLEEQFPLRYRYSTASLTEQDEIKLRDGIVDFDTARGYRLLSLYYISLLQVFDIK